VVWGADHQEGRQATAPTWGMSTHAGRALAGPGVRSSSTTSRGWVDFNGAALHVRRVKNGTRAPTRSRAMNLGRCAGSSARVRVKFAHQDGCAEAVLLADGFSID
jgi:hypothetical protein